MVRIEESDDELTMMLRDARVRESEISERDLARLRAQFVTAATAPTIRTTSPTRWLWAGVGGIAALGSAGAVTAALVLAPASMVPPVDQVNASWADSEPLTVSVAMTRAAENVSDPLDLLVEPGQFLSIRVSETQLLGWNKDGDDGDDGAPGTEEPLPTPTTAPPPNVVDGAVLISSVRTLSVPADRTADWTWMWEPQTVGQAYGDRTAEQIVTDSQIPLDGESHLITYPAGMEPAPDGPRPGRISQGPLPFDDYAPHYNQMPREPQALLDWYRNHGRVGDDTGGDAWIVRSILDLTTTVNLAPADVRAARFRALALIDGLEVASSDENIATLRYRDQSNAQTMLFEVDMKHGYLLSTSVTADRKSSTVPDSVPDLSTTIQISVTDEALTLP